MYRKFIFAQGCAVAQPNARKVKGIFSILISPKENQMSFMYHNISADLNRNREKNPSAHAPKCATTVSDKTGEGKLCDDITDCFARYAEQLRKKRERKQTKLSHKKLNHRIQKQSRRLLREVVSAWEQLKSHFKMAFLCCRNWPHKISIDWQWCLSYFPWGGGHVLQAISFQ